MQDNRSIDRNPEGFWKRRKREEGGDFSDAGKGNKQEEAEKQMCSTGKSSAEKGNLGGVEEAQHVEDNENEQGCRQE